MAVTSHQAKKLPARPAEFWDPRTRPRRDKAGALHVFAYDDVLRVLTNGQLFSADYGIREEDAEYVHPMLLGLWTCGDPRHADLRAALKEPFHRRRTDELRPQLRHIVDDLLDAVTDKVRPRVELIAEVAKPYHLQATCRLLGLDISHAEMFDRWIATAAEAMAVGEIPPDPEQTTFWRKLIEQRRVHPETGLVDDLIAAQRAGYMVAGKPMSDWDLVGYYAMLLAAGYEVISGIANTILFAVEFGTVDALYANPGLLPGAIEESLRYYPPFVTTERRATADVDFAGYSLKPGDRVVGWITAANRDPDRFPNPDLFDIRRDPQHLAFGWGPRFCFGAPMARLEMLVALEAILERFPRLRRDWDRPLERTYGIVDPLTALHCTFVPQVHR